MTQLEREKRALDAGGLVIQGVILATQRAVTDLTIVTSVWSPEGFGRVSYSTWQRRVGLDMNLLDTIMSGIAKTDWARRGYRQPFS